MTGVPANADILAAYLFWETLTFEAQPAQASARFRGVQLDLDDDSVVKKSSNRLVQPQTAGRLEVL